MKTIRLTVEFLFSVPDQTNPETISLSGLLQDELVIKTIPGVELLQYETTLVEEE